MARSSLAALRFGIVVALTVAPYFVLSKLASGSYSFHGSGWALWSQDPVSALRIPAENLYFYFKGLTLLTFVYFPSFFPNVLWLKIGLMAMVGGAALMGAVRTAKTSGGRFLLVYFVGYGIVCILWPFQGPRFVFPVYPLFLFWFMAGFESMVAGRFRAASAGALVLLILATNGREVRDILVKSMTQPADIPHQSHLWIKEHSRPEDLIVSMDIAEIRYYAGRRGVHFVPSDSLESFVRRSRELGARYFFLKPAGYVSMTPGAKDFVKEQHDRLAEYTGHAEYFDLVYENGEEGAKIFVLKTISSSPISKG